MDPVRHKLTRCYRCAYYVCVCQSQQGRVQEEGKEGKGEQLTWNCSKWPVNHVEALSAMRDVRAKDFKWGKGIRNGAWYSERIGHLKQSKKYFIVRKLRLDSNHRKNVEREKQALSKLSCGEEPQRVLRVLLQFDDVGASWLVLEHIQGGQLCGLIGQRGALGTEEAKYYGAQLCAGVEYLHRLNIAHRDLNSENVLVESSGRVKISNFSLAIQLERGDRTLTLVGTPNYMAPEVYRSIVLGESLGHCHGYGRAVDWWSCGALLYEMVQGVPPFAEMDAASIFDLLAHLDCTAQSVGEVLPKVRRCVDHRAWSLILELLDLNAERRQDAGERVRSHKFFKFLRHETLPWAIVAERCQPPEPLPLNDWFPAVFVPDYMCKETT